MRLLPFSKLILPVLILISCSSDDSVNKLNDGTEILSFKLKDIATTSSNIDKTNKVIELGVAFGTDLTSLIAEFTLSEGSTAEVNGILQTSGETLNDFTNIVSYVVTAEDGKTITNWDVIIIPDEGSTETEIIAFDFANIPFSDVSINTESKSIVVKLPFNTGISDLIATFSISHGATIFINNIEQESGVTANDYSGPVTFTVVAENPEFKSDWTISVMLLDEQPYVTTLASIPSNGGIAVSADGTIYTTSESDKIYRITPTGEVETFIENNDHITRATMIIFDNNEEFLYISNTPTDRLGWISKVALDATSEIYIDSIVLPTGIAFDEMNQLYVADQTNTVWRVDENGEQSVFAQSSTFNRPHGMAFVDGTLFVSSAHDGNIFKLSTVEASPSIDLFAHVDGLQQQWASGYMMYANNFLYITNGDNKVHQIDMDGEVVPFAGNGNKGASDGPASYATFNGPNGIGGLSDGSILYVGEYGVNRIRKIQNN